MRTITPITTTRHRLTRSALAAAVGLTFLGLGAQAAAAETPGYEPGATFAQPGGDPDPQPPVIDDLEAVPADPDPDPHPAPGGIEIPVPQPDPGPIDDFAAPHGEPDPDPTDGPDGFAPVPDDDDPGPADGIDDLVSGGCQATHGCEPECPGLSASCDLTDGDPGDGDPGDDPTGDGDPAGEPEVPDGSSPLGRLPHTGGGLAVLATLGAAVTGAGVALRRFDR